MMELKGMCHEILSLLFYDQSNPAGPLIKNSQATHTLGVGAKIVAGLSSFLKGQASELCI